MGVRLVRHQTNVSGGIIWGGIGGSGGSSGGTGTGGGSTGTGGGNGTYKHDYLLNRDYPDQHPIHAITGLQEALNNLEDDIVVASTSITKLSSYVNYVREMEYHTSTTVRLNYYEDTLKPSLTAHVRLWYDFTDPDHSEHDYNILQSYYRGLYVPETLFIDTSTIDFSTWSTRISHVDDTDSVYAIKVSAHAKISNRSNNSLTVKDDGLYVQAYAPSNQTVLNNFSTNTNGELLYNGQPISGNAEGCVHKVTQTSHGFVVGDFICYKSNAYCKGIAKDTADINIVGVVSKVLSVNVFEYQSAGFLSIQLFSKDNGYIQGLPIYLSETEAGKGTQAQPDISKTVAYPVENKGIIISIERGIQYNLGAAIGDFKVSANTYNVRSDGFIRVAEDVTYETNIIQQLLDTLSEDFKSNYININGTSVTFKNVEQIYTHFSVTEGFSVFIKAF